MIDYTSVLKTTHNCLLDYTYTTFNVNRSDAITDWRLPGTMDYTGLDFSCKIGVPEFDRNVFIAQKVNLT